MIRTVEGIPDTRLRETDQTENNGLIYGPAVKPFQQRDGIMMVSFRLLLAGHDFNQLDQSIR
jgi:hypothetical protein